MPALTQSATSPADLTTTSSPPGKKSVGRKVYVWPPSLRLLSIRRPREDDLLGVVHAGRDDRVLVVGEGTADMLSDVLHRGCRSGSAFRTAPAHPEAAEVMVAPTIRTEEAGQAVVACARRALPPGGRLVLRAIGQGAAELARRIADRLRACGFEAVRLCGRPEGALVVCRAPGTGKKVR